MPGGLWREDGVLLGARMWRPWLGARKAVLPGGRMCRPWVLRSRFWPRPGCPEGGRRSGPENLWGACECVARL